MTADFKKRKISEALKMLDELFPPITLEWLRKNDFKLCGRQPGQEENRSRRISNELSVEVAPNHHGTPDEPNYYVWLVQEEPRRSIHIYHMNYQRQLISLIEGLTDQEWKEAE